MDNHGFASVDGLWEIDIGSGDRPRPTYVSAKSNPKCKSELIDLLKEVLFSLNETLGLDQSIV